MSKTGKMLSILGLTAAVGAPVAVFAATKAETTKAESTKVETITCPLTGEQIKPCCCPINK